MPVTSTSVVVSLADGIVSVLASGMTAFDTPFTPARKLIAVQELTGVPDLTVAVVPPSPAPQPLVLLIPVSDDEERLGGGTTPSFMGDYSVDCLIYARVGADGEALAATLMVLRQQIRDFLKGQILLLTGPRGKTTRAVLERIEGSPAYDHSVLLRQHCFFSAQRFAWKVAV
jgi:hypothetical protein